jgi:hypothetical protein
MLHFLVVFTTTYVTLCTHNVKKTGHQQLTIYLNIMGLFVNFPVNRDFWIIQCRISQTLLMCVCVCVYIYICGVFQEESIWLKGRSRKTSDSMVSTKCFLNFYLWTTAARQLPFFARLGAEHRPVVTISLSLHTNVA